MKWVDAIPSHRSYTHTHKHSRAASNLKRTWMSEMCRDRPHNEPYRIEKINVHPAHWKRAYDCMSIMWSPLSLSLPSCDVVHHFFCSRCAQTSWYIFTFTENSPAEQVFEPLNVRRQRNTRQRYDSKKFRFYKFPNSMQRALFLLLTYRHIRVFVWVAKCDSFQIHINFPFEIHERNLICLHILCICIRNVRYHSVWTRC